MFLVLLFWFELMISEFFFSVMWVRLFGTMWILFWFDSMKGCRSIWCGAMFVLMKVGEVESASVGWVMKLLGFVWSLVPNFFCVLWLEVGLISML